MHIATAKQHFGTLPMMKPYGFEISPALFFVEPFQGSRSMWLPTQGCASLTRGCWMKPLLGTDRKSQEIRGRVAEKAHSRNATAVSIVRGGRRAGTFAECQQLAEGAPLLRKPLSTRGSPRESADRL